MKSGKEYTKWSVDGLSFGLNRKDWQDNVDENKQNLWNSQCENY
jgi:hypothetical protein